MSILKRSSSSNMPAPASRPAPYVVAADLANSARAHFQSQLSSRQRKRFVAIVRKSGGNPSKLSKRQRKELSHLIKAFDPVAFVKTESAKRRGR